MTLRRLLTAVIILSATIGFLGGYIAGWSHGSTVFVTIPAPREGWKWKAQRCSWDPPEWFGLEDENGGCPHWEDPGKAI